MLSTKPAENLFKTMFNSFKPGLSTRELPKLNETWIFDRSTVDLTQA
jgi:hypothetical protein